MFLGYQNNRIAFVAETREELENLPQVRLDKIIESDEKYIYYKNQYLTEAEVEAKTREYIAHLNLTGADVERGIYKAKGMDFEDIIAFVTANPPLGLDIKALKIELKANNFYRGNPYVNAVGSLLGFTSEQLDKFFEDGNYEHLLPEEEPEPTEGVNEEETTDEILNQVQNDTTEQDITA